MPTTTVIEVDSLRPDAAAIARAAGVILAGGLVAFPTETVYGLGADARNAGAVRAVYAAKGRPARNPLIVHVVDARAAEALAAEWPRHAVVLAEHFWPGPLTMVVRRGETVAAEVAAGGATVAVRVPAHPVALALIASAGAPIAAPSANRSSRVSPTTAAHVLRDLRDRIDMVLDGGSTPIGIESTVLDLTTDPPALLRPGRITPSELSAYIGEVRVAGRAAGGATSLRSPGMLERHYAPAAPVRLAAPPGDDVVRDLLQAGDRVGWLRLGRSSLAHERLTAIAMPEDARAYAAMLYAALHRLEDAGVEKIVVSAPPETENWSAVRDRLSRAATPGITR